MSRQKARPALTYPPVATPPEGAVQGALLFGYFLLGKQEKVTRAAAAARNPRLKGETHSR